MINEEILIVVPARGGSKGVKDKNLRKFNDFSLIENVANVVNELNFGYKLVISSDSSRIIEEAKRVGMHAPFVRPLSLASDDASSVDVWIHAWDHSEKYFNQKFRLSILLEPTSPMRTAQDIEQTLNVLINGDFKSVLTLSRTPAHFTPEKTLWINHQSSVQYYHEKGVEYNLRQNIPEYYHRNGICYAITKERLFEEKRIIGSSKTGWLIIDRPVVNIDSELDFIMGEALFKIY